MTTVTVIGASGFVGSAFCRYLHSVPDVQLVGVTRETYQEHRGRHSDVTIDCAGNSRKYLAEENPREDLTRTIDHRLRTLQDFPADLQVHVSSVDVYDRLDSPATTREECALHLPAPSNYALHKRIAEEFVRHYAPQWLILRLAGMVGRGLHKNPVYDIVNGLPLWIHPDSRYQFLGTDDVARIGWEIASGGYTGEVFNVCGRGLVSPHEISQLVGHPLNLNRVAPDAKPRIVDVSIDKLARFADVPDTIDAVRSFLRVEGRDVVQ